GLTVVMELRARSTRASFSQRRIHYLTTDLKPFEFSPIRRPAVRNAAMGLLSHVGPRRSNWTKSPTTWDWTRQRCANSISFRPTRLRQIGFVLALSPWASASIKSWRAPVGKTSSESFLTERESGSRVVLT